MDSVLQVPKSRKYKHFHSRLITRTVASEYILSFAISFLFFFVIFLINQLIVVTRDVLSKTDDFLKSMLLLWYSLPAVIALSFPFGSLVGTLLAVARLGSDNEILAIQSLGLSIRMVFLPIFIISLSLTGISFFLNNALLPYSFMSYRNLRDELLYSNTELILEPFSIKRFNNTTIITDEVKDGVLDSILLFDTGESGRTRIISAQKAILNKEMKSTGIIQLELEKAEIIEQGQEFNDLDRTQLESLLYTMKLKDLINDKKSITPAEMSFIDIDKRIKTMQDKLEIQKKEQVQKVLDEENKLIQNYYAQTNKNTKNKILVYESFDRLEALKKQKIVDRNLQSHKVEYWKKITIPVACTTLVVLGFPLGIFARKNARGLGFGFGLLIAVFYWSSIFAGQFLSMNYPASESAIFMWAPNILFLILGLILMAFGRNK